MKRNEYLLKFLPFLLNGFGTQRRFVIIHDIPLHLEDTFRQVVSKIKSIDSVDTTLTFDDGFISSYNAIKKVKHNQAIFFVSPGFLNCTGNKNKKDFFKKKFLRNVFYLEKRPLPEYIQPATWESLKELIANDHIIGAHTVNHVKLSDITSPKELEYEIISSGDMIEDRLNKKVEWFSYPFGDISSINKKAYKIIKKRYQYCCTGIRGNNNDRYYPYAIWRDFIDLSWPTEYIEFVLKGGLDWYYFFKRRKLFKMVKE